MAPSFSCRPQRTRCDVRLWIRQPYSLRFFSSYGYIRSHGRSFRYRNSEISEWDKPAAGMWWFRTCVRITQWPNPWRVHEASSWSILSEFSRTSAFSLQPPTLFFPLKIWKIISMFSVPPSPLKEQHQHLWKSIRLVWKVIIIHVLDTFQLALATRSFFIPRKQKTLVIAIYFTFWRHKGVWLRLGMTMNPWYWPSFFVD